MIIDIDDELFFKIKELIKKRNIGIYNQLEHIKQLKETSTDILIKARAVKTTRKKEEIKIAIKELIHSNINVSMYQVHKKTAISYKTLHKYYRDIFDEVLEEIKS